MTRNYGLSLVQEFNGTCSQVPEILAIMDYGAYYEWKANKGIITAGARMNLDRQFQQMMECCIAFAPSLLTEGDENTESVFVMLAG